MNPKDPQADIREAIKELVDSWVLSLADEYDNASDRVKQTLEDNAASPEDWDSLLSPIMKLFQAHQQELLSELLGGAEDFEKWVGYNQQNGRAITVSAVPVSVIEKYREGL